jgi:acetolactate synthase-1/2/3 large subunit
VLVRHEQAAVHAADGYARATGDVGVALVTSGPGVTNAVTGIATAYMDSIPMVIITGPGADGRHRPRRLPGVRHRRHHAAHRQAQLPGQGRAHLADVLKKAFHIARSGRPGPVVVDIPKDVSFNKTAWTGYPDKVEMRSYNPVRKGHGGQIRKALQLLLAPSGPTSTPAAAWSWAMPPRNCARWPPARLPGAPTR